MSFHPTTQRLILRALVLADMSPLVTLLDDYEVSKNLISVPHPFAEAHFHAFLTRQAQKRQAGIGHVFAVTRAMDGAFIGICGLDRLDGDVWEFGYWYGRLYWGQGYATEAARPVLRFAFDDLGAQAAAAGWFADNPASGRVLEKLGFTLSGTLTCNSAARGGEVLSNRVQLTRGEFARKKAA
jgi:8-oxo-dGTP diphosphatase